ncbi:MAG: hypothetical protein ACM3Q4_11965, partial [Acidobacteriota bacterium]
LHRPEDAIDDSEVFTMNSLDLYKLKQELLQAKLCGRAIREEYQRVASSGVLPHGAAGRILYADLCSDVEIFAQGLEAQMTKEKLPDAVLDLALAGFRLTGVIPNIDAEKLLFYRMAVLKPRDYLSAWITHLSLQAMRLPGYPSRTVFCGVSGTKIEVKEFGAIDDPESRLADLIAFYREGMTRPLKFFPDASMRYADAIRHGKSEEEALDAARSNWTQSYSGAAADSDDLYIRQCFAESDPFDAEFCENALRIFQPLSRALDAKRGGEGE